MSAIYVFNFFSLEGLFLWHLKIQQTKIVSQVFYLAVAKGFLILLLKSEITIFLIPLFDTAELYEMS
jgi:hypothetical protein